MEASMTTSSSSTPSCSTIHFLTLSNTDIGRYQPPG
jgi:hypothetical protein